MADGTKETAITGVVFWKEAQGLRAVFGPALLFERFANGSDVSVVTHYNLEKLPQEFLNEAVVSQGKLRPGTELGLGENQNVLLLPWALLPEEFNVVSYR